MTPMFLEFLLEALVNGARIDDRADESEREVIAQVMSEAKGAPFSRAEVDAAIARATLTREQLSAYLKRVGSHFSTEERMALLRGVTRVFAADGRLHEAETAALLGYIEAIGFDGGPSVLEKIMQPFRNAV